MATFDGFWAFELERSVYALEPADVGTFDLVHVGDLLLHLENPIAALRSIRRVTRSAALIADAFNPTLGGRLARYLGSWQAATWWDLSLETLAQMVLMPASPTWSSPRCTRCPPEALDRGPGGQRCGPPSE